MASTDWQARAAAKRAAITAQIPAAHRLDRIPSADEQRDVTGAYVQQFLSPREIEITETDAVGIVKRTTAGDWTAVEVTRAFCHRAAIAHQLVNCLHEIFFDAAIADAEALDAYYAAHGGPIGPLHGLPVSLKDQFHVGGVETTMGYVGWIGTFEGETGTGREGVVESEMVRELRRLGAVLYCKTAVPHTLMAGETTNHIIGYCWNPRNRLLSAGGSSGGEGALIALRGSPVGFGTDIGGSIRIPAAYNGLYGLRPSTGRLPYAGMANSMDGQITVPSVVGPLATSAAGLTLVVKAILSQEPWLHDPMVIEMPWRDEIERQVAAMLRTEGPEGKLAFGLLKHDGVVTPHPPVRRAMEIVAQTLRKLGHDVIDWDPPSPCSHADLASLINRIFTQDNGHNIHAALALSSEPMLLPITALYSPTPQPPTTTHPSLFTLNRTIRTARTAHLTYWRASAHRTATRRPVDALLAPVAPCAAARPDRGAAPAAAYIGYASWVNVLDYAAAVVPVMTADRGRDPVDAVEVERRCRRTELDCRIAEAYDPEVYHGAPVGVQVVGGRLQEEKVLALAAWLGERLKAAGAGDGVAAREKAFGRNDG